VKRFLGFGLFAMAASVASLGFGQAAAPPPAPAPAPDAAKAAAAPTALLTDAVPALWKVKGVHGTVYLFGTIHVMKKDVNWETAKVKDALGASDTLYLEIAGLDDAAMTAAQPLLMELGTDKEHVLSTKISKADVDLLDSAAKTLGAPGEQVFESLQPWMAYLTISVVPLVQAGYDPNSGIDKKLEAEATSGKKTVKGFETLEGQVHFMADLPMALQTQMLHQMLTDLPQAVSDTDAMVADWTRGDVEAIGKLENEEMRDKYPELYKTLLLKRNEHFADTLAGQLKDPATGTEFVAIGAAHLAGEDSVVKMLATRGFTAERVE
jgi:uncharacterized protein YbaP (TraB family)